VYNALVNSLHAPWNQYALNAGKQVLSEKPFASNAAEASQVWTVAGTAATAVVPAFAVPHLDNRIVITRDGSTGEQTLGEHTSYTYQLAALADTLQTGAEFLIDVDDSVANAELIDEVYLGAGLSPRG
jgi:predicted dehydrogenase